MKTPRVHRATTWATAATVACSVVGCHGRDESASPSTTSAPLSSAVAAASTAASAPRDHLGPGELVEGTAAPFGIALPRGFVVESSFTDQAIASGPSKAADVANFLRSRLNARTATVGAASTIFEQVQSSARPGHDLVIRVEPRPDGNGTLVTVRDVTPPPTEPNIPEAERWRRAGLTPEGKILDPTHLQ